MRPPAHLMPPCCMLAWRNTVASFQIGLTGAFSRASRPHRSRSGKDPRPWAIRTHGVSIAPRGNARGAHRAPQGLVSDDTADHTAKARLWTSSEPVGLRSMPSFEGGTPVPPSEVHRATISWLWRNHIHCAPLGLGFTGLWPGSVGRPPEYRQTQIAMPQSPHARRGPARSHTHGALQIFRL